MFIGNVLGVKNYSEYVDRGDPASLDWDKNDLTLDGSYIDLDCSGIVPPGAKFIAFRVYLINTANSQGFILKKNGNSNGYNIRSFYTTAANSPYEGFAIIPCDDGRVVEYLGQASTWTNCDIVIMGWII